MYGITGLGGLLAASPDGYKPPQFAPKSRRTQTHSLCFARNYDFIAQVRPFDVQIKHGPHELLLFEGIACNREAYRRTDGASALNKFIIGLRLDD
jgi:hypothetical protein